MNGDTIWYLILPIALILLVVAIAVFFWSVKSNQFEDLDRHGNNILFDDDQDAHHQAQSRKGHDDQSA
ncbi:cbb3-type cytochrome oxidase assembly protein CcoS [Oceanimonas baumannii]|uniref:Cbb3-type cytochrome oxidase assembly protein CcoS n=1 Tax=Oceanimonas baumannii TaxID=129578 RepID=A0A235CH19_9GAMM|nr:cbb3-type cytochrome oxidase assembly protein CcoS [Oceanimonas baumannii]OYD23840.1 cbb3-type cytochrome oxidase assembly protein CcoS [Oceanimonas baumannii]TDW58835.1 cbb3-type cytochrome oxidase maturation protein [Oceanimonas baumannii]